MDRKILILDYSVNREETAIIKSCISQDENLHALFIDSEDSFPNDLIEQVYTHVIHTGSVLSINEDAPFTKKAMQFIRDFKDEGGWQMGICYGHQLVCRALIGLKAVQSSHSGFEVGWENVNFTSKAMNLLGVRGTEKVWQHHFDEVIKMPEGSELLATNAHCRIQAYINFEQHILGTQFHPEFNRKSGNQYFINDRDFIEKQNFKVNKMIKQGPSFNSGKVFFDFFLAQTTH